MKKQLIMGTVSAIVALNNISPVLAASGSVQEWAQQDAEQAVIDKHLVDEDEVRQRGEEYTSAFLAAFAKVSQTYEQSFQQGMTAALNGQAATPPPAGKVARVAYQRGFDRGTALARQAHGSAPGVLPAPVPVPGGNPPTGQQGAKAGGQAALPNAPRDDQHYPVKKPTPNQARFITRIAKSAQRVGREYDLYPSIIIAQAALESNWGVSDLAQKPYHNLFGVKGVFNGHSVRQPTTEFTKDGQEIKINDDFRWYENDYQSLCDYAETLTDPLYATVHRSQASSYRAATHALLGKYATDPQYDRKLNQVIDTYQLTKYDHQPRQGQVAVNKHVQTPSVEKTATTPKAAPARVSHPHRLTWLSAIGGLGSAGALGLLRRFICIK